MGELLWQVAGALQWLHGRGFAHLDVKPDNILIMRRRGTGERKSAWSFKLSDFGLVGAVGALDVDVPGGHADADGGRRALLAAVEMGGA